VFGVFLSFLKARNGFFTEGGTKIENAGICRVLKSLITNLLSNF
jgi:hypothetical protein